MSGWMAGADDGDNDDDDGHDDSHDSRGDRSVVRSVVPPSVAAAAIGTPSDSRTIYANQRDQQHHQDDSSAREIEAMISPWQQRHWIMQEANERSRLL